MKKYFLSVLVLSIVFLFGCSKAEPFLEDENTVDAPQAGLYQDSGYGVSFEYPAHWETRTKEDYVLFASNFDYFDGIAKGSTSTELEGTLKYSVTQNPENLSMKAFYDASYEECQDVPKSADIGPMCYQPRFESGWEVLEIDGYPAYQSDWDGVAESGSIVKDIYVDLLGKGAFIHLSAIKTGLTDEEAIQKTAEDAFASLSIK